MTESTKSRLTSPCARSSSARTTHGLNRLFLNNKPLFQYGPLDQGCWPDGLYTAPTDEALKYDIEITKKLGFNMGRKHVKVEPARWYYHCDKLGLLVWQDMPSGDRYIGGNDPDIDALGGIGSQFPPRVAGDHRLAAQPSRRIVVWVPFNEGWGQFNTNDILEWTKKLRPDAAGRWPQRLDRPRRRRHARHAHAIPARACSRRREARASVLGEFGGLGLPLEGPPLAGQGELGLPHLQDAGRTADRTTKR